MGQERGRAAADESDSAPRKRRTALNAIAPVAARKRTADEEQGAPIGERAGNAGALDGVRDAVGSRPKRSTAAVEASPASTAKREHKPSVEASALVAPDARVQAVMTALQRRFVRVGHDYYFPDGARAFTDRSQRLTTPSENTEVVKSLVQIAQARGWEAIRVSGSERFRRQAWTEAQKVGIEARGYRPSKFEREYAVRARTRELEAPRVTQTGEVIAEPEREGRIARAQSAQTRGGSTLITGRLVDHGPARYKNEPQGSPSYFVKLEGERGEQTVWGVDLERALRESLSKAKIGDEVAVRSVRREPVTVKAAQRDAEGNLIGAREIDVHRNRWIIEQQSFLKERATAARTFRDAKVGAQQGARAHPELVGSYVQLRGAEEFAAQRIRDREDQRRFVSLVRATLADAIERGEALTPVRLRTRTEARDAREPSLAR